MEALIPAQNSQSYNRRAVTEKSQRKNSSWKTTEYQNSSITAQKFINVSKLTFSTFESLWKSFSHTHADPASSNLLENLRKIYIKFDCLQPFYYGKIKKITKFAFETWRSSVFRNICSDSELLQIVQFFGTFWVISELLLFQKLHCLAS